MDRFIKVPVNFNGVPYKDRRLYVRFLDMKLQTTEGIFRIKVRRHRRTYYREAAKLVDKGWARRCTPGEKGLVALRSYQHVWRDLGVMRYPIRRRGNRAGYVYYKVPCGHFADDRPTYLRQIECEIKKRLAKRQAAQIRWRLNNKACNENTQATFSARSAARLFGYRSPSTGSKLRKENFEVIPGPSVPYFNRVTGRYEEPTKRIAL